MTSPASSVASLRALAASGIHPAKIDEIGIGTSSAATGGVPVHQSPDDRAFLDSNQFQKIQSTAQQALAQCMELGLHVLPIHSAEQRDMLAARLVEAAYKGVSGACSCRNLGAALPSLTQLIPPGRDLQHPQQLEQHAQNGTQSIPSQEVTHTTESPHGIRSNGMQGSEAPHVAQHASPTVGSEAPGGSRKRPAEASPEASGSPFKRQQMERGMAAQLAVSSAVPAGNVASLMTNLEQEVSQDLAQWSETRNAGILDSISAKIEGANAALQSRAAAAEPAQSPGQAASEQQAQAAALAKIEAINSRLAQAGVAPHVVPAVAPSVSDALAVKFAAANASFMQAMPASAAASSSAPSSLPAPGASAAAAAAGAGPDAAKLAALDAKLAQFQQITPSSGTAASAPARSDNFALLDAKLARYGSAPAGPSQLPTNGLYQPSLPQKMGFAPGMAAAGFPTNGTGVLSGAGFLGAGRPTLTSVAGGWQAGSLGGQAPGAQLGWQQPGIGGLQAHTPGVNAPMTSMPRGPLHNGVGILGAAPSGFRGAPGAVAGSRPMSGPDVKARLQQEALARLQQVNKGWRS